MNILIRITDPWFKAALLLLLITSSSYASLAFTIQTPALVLDHEITIASLLPDTKYYYRIGNAAGFVPTGAIMVTREPYLQMATPNSMTVKWSTSITTESRIDYGSVAIAGGASFVTSPTTGSAKPTRIWVIGDAGKTSANVMRDAYLAYTGSRGTDVWLMLGDNAYSNGTEIEYQAKVFNLFSTLLPQLSPWATFGNHDAMSSNSTTQTGPYFKAFKFPTLAEAGGIASNTEAYYAFDYGNIHFICLDSQLSNSTLPGSTMLNWLVNDLTANQSDWTIVFFHHPPYSKGSHNSDTETRLVQVRENVLPILEAHGVDLVLSGHSHSYERSKFIDGHYGLSTSLLPSMILDGGNGQITGTGAYTKAVANGNAHLGTVYVTAGNSGWLRSAALNHPVMATSLLFRGSIVIDISGNRLDANAIDDAGVVRDNFTIIQQQAVDVTAPVVTPPANITVEATCPTTVVVLGVATALDNIDGPLTPTANPAGPFTKGVHTIIWSAIDAAGNTGVANQTVTVVDTTAPLITMTGSNVTIATGTVYLDEGATALDSVDGALTPTATSTVDTAIAGNYTVTYNVSDISLNAATPVVRTVSVVPNTPPTVIPPANITNREATATLTAVALGAASATDALGNSLPVTPDNLGPFTVGVHQVVWRATNAAGITGAAMQSVSIVDTTAPVITMVGGNISIEGGSTYADNGAVAIDAGDPNVTVSIVSTSTVNVNLVGNYTVTYNITDASGNAANPIVRSVTVVDTTAAVISLNGATPVTLIAGNAYTDAGAVATDAMNGVVALTGASNVNTNVPGSYTVIYNHTDLSNNFSTQVTRIVNVAAAGTSSGGSAAQIALMGAAGTVTIVSVGQALTHFSATATTGSSPAGISFPFGAISYSTTVPINGSQTVNLTFSTALSSSLVLYKVDSAGLYTLIPKGSGANQWYQVNATSIALTLTDNGRFDLDNSANGVIVDPVAVGVPTPPAASAPAASGGGGCAILQSAPFDPVMLMMLLIGFVCLTRKHHSNIKQC